jgi:hypothetical protein
MVLAIVLAVIQTVLLIPVILIVALYWEEETLKAPGVRGFLLNFIWIMCIVEGIAWVFGEFGLISLSSGLDFGLEVLTTTLSINVIFILSIVMAVFTEIRLRRES